MWVGAGEDGPARLDNVHFALLERIKVVSVFLDTRDDPQVIFEALNYKGVPLDATDLVKNLLDSHWATDQSASAESALTSSVTFRVSSPTGAWPPAAMTSRTSRMRPECVRSVPNCSSSHGLNGGRD